MEKHSRRILRVAVTLMAITVIAHLNIYILYTHQQSTHTYIEI